MDIIATLEKLAMESGFAAFFTTEGGWKNLVMIIIAFVLLYLGIVKKFEPLLLCGIAFGYEDSAHPANTFRTSRAPLAQAVHWVE